MRVLPWLTLALASLPALADEVSPPAHPQPVAFGYAFDQPALLLRQRIFGLAHGAMLLVSACLDREAQAEATQNAYAFWHAAQRATLDGVRQALAVHHFGAQAEQVQWQDIARVLGLKETIYPSLGTVSLAEACATLPEALMQSRYDFTAQLELADAPVPR